MYIYFVLSPPLVISIEIQLYLLFNFKIDNSSNTIKESYVASTLYKEST